MAKVKRGEYCCSEMTRRVIDGVIISWMPTQMKYEIHGEPCLEAYTFETCATSDHFEIIYCPWCGKYLSERTKRITNDKEET